MKYEVWKKEHDNTDEITVCNIENKNEDDTKDAILLTSFEADSYNEAMQKYYDFMGFGEYKPF